MGNLVPPEELERRRARKRITEFDATIEIWSRKRNEAAAQVAIATRAKRGFVDSLDSTLKAELFAPR